jgi:hypothetical protein
MKQIAYLQINKYRRKYNDVVRRKLESAGIRYREISVRYGYRLMVNESDFSAANRIVLEISHTNPQY